MAKPREKQNRGARRIAPLVHTAASALAVQRNWACRDQLRLDNALETSRTDAARHFD